MANDSERVKLKFYEEVSSMLERAEVFENRFSTDQVALAAVDPALTVAWGADFASWIADARSAVPPQSAKGDLMVITGEANRLLAQARDAVQQLFFYVKRAFSDSVGKPDAYGKREYGPARTSRGRMLLLMEQAAQNFTADQAELVAAGFSVAKQTEFMALYNSLQSANTAQGIKKGENKDITNEYYIKLNRVWEGMARLNAAAMFAFKNDWASWQSYLLHKKRKKKKKADDMAVAVAEVNNLSDAVKDQNMEIINH